MTFFSSIAAGYLQKRVRSFLLVLIGGLAIASAWFFTSFVTSVTILYLVFSLIGGSGDGIVYNTAVAAAVKWFPDRKGFANGICIGAAGLSPIIFAPLGNYLIESLGVAISFRIVGLIFFVCFVAVSWFVRTPDDDWVPPKHEESNVVCCTHEMDTRGMLRQPLFYAMWLMFTIACTSGMMMIGHASTIGEQMAGLTSAQGALQVGVLALANFAGRFGFGSLSDRIGRFNALIIALILTAVDMLVLALFIHDFVSFSIVLAVAGLGFGGTMTIMPSLCGDAFGTKHFGLNYAILFSGYSCAAFVGPLLAATVVQNTGSYAQAFVIAGVLVLAGLLVWVWAKKSYAHLRKADAEKA